MIQSIFLLPALLLAASAVVASGKPKTSDELFELSHLAAQHASQLQQCHEQHGVLKYLYGASLLSVKLMHISIGSGVSAEDADRVHQSLIRFYKIWGPMNRRRCDSALKSVHFLSDGMFEDALREVAGAPKRMP
jgi:hypothetical protein